MSDRSAINALRQQARITRGTAAPVAEFEKEGRKRALVRPVVSAVLAGMLSVGVAVAALTTASASSKEQDRSSTMVDRTMPDKASAAPVDLTITAEQAAARKAIDADPNRTDVGGLAGFEQRGTTVNRNSVRAQLNNELNQTNNTDRTVELVATNDDVTQAQSSAAQKQREQEMDADIAKVKAESARIQEEKRKAEELLRKQQEEAKKRAALGGPGATDTTSASSSDGDQANQAPGAPVDTKGLTSGSGAFPLRPGSFRVGAGWGATGSWARYHTGQDFGAGCGTPVYAAADGVSGRPVGGWAGNSIVLYHANGGSTLYAHLSARAISQGQVVKAGQLIGYVGNTGRSFGCHLHFEYYPAGTTPGDVYRTSNPLRFLRTLGVAI